MDNKQRKLLILLEYFNKVCNENNIWYSLACGSVLGSIRYKGFIPWDKDVDVFVRIKDLDKIRRKFTEQRNNDILYRNYTDGNKRTNTHDTLFFSNIRSEIIHLDIYPIIGAPNAKIARYIFAKALFILNRIFKTKYVDLNYTNHKLTKYVKAIIRHVPDQLIKNTIKNIEHYYNYDNAKFVIYFANDGKYKEVMEKEIIINTTLGDFEGKKFPIPQNYHHYLSRIYGDYMTPKKY